MVRCGCRSAELLAPGFRELVTPPFSAASLQHRGKSVSVIHGDTPRAASILQRNDAENLERSGLNDVEFACATTGSVKGIPGSDRAPKCENFSIWRELGNGRDGITVPLHSADRLGLWQLDLLPCARVEIDTPNPVLVSSTSTHHSAGGVRKPDGDRQASGSTDSRFGYGRTVIYRPSECHRFYRTELRTTDEPEAVVACVNGISIPASIASGQCPIEVAV